MKHFALLLLMVTTNVIATECKTVDYKVIDMTTGKSTEFGNISETKPWLTRGDLYFLRAFSSDDIVADDDRIVMSNNYLPGKAVYVKIGNGRFGKSSADSSVDVTVKGDVVTVVTTEKQFAPEKTIAIMKCQDYVIVR